MLGVHTAGRVQYFLSMFLGLVTRVRVAEGGLIAAKDAVLMLIVCRCGSSGAGFIPDKNLLSMCLGLGPCVRITEIKSAHEEHSPSAKYTNESVDL